MALLPEQQFSRVYHLLHFRWPQASQDNNVTSAEAAEATDVLVLVQHIVRQAQA